VGAAALLLACGPSPRRDPNVILVLIDTLRPDHLGSYGYSRHTSPNLDKLGAEGVVVRNVIAQAPATIPSVPALFTSRYASRSIDAGQRKIQDRATTLAEALRDHGYQTAAFSSNPLVTRHRGRGLRGFDRGFGLFDDSVATAGSDERWNPQRRSPSGIVRKAIDWLERRAADGKFFLYLHIMDPHDRYWPPKRYRSLYHHGYEGEEAIARGHPTAYEHRILEGEEVSLSSSDIEHLRALYDAEITYVDVQVGRLLEKLRAMELLDDTIVVVTSDHGEEFFEHGGLKHGYTLYQEAIQVPWLMRYPRTLPSEEVLDDSVVQLIDVAPTILDLAGAPIPGEMQGASLLPRIRGEASPASRRYAITESGYAGTKAIVTDTWKYIHHFGERPWRKNLARRYAEGTELYNLTADPKERVNCISEHRDTAAWLHELLLRSLANAEGHRADEGDELSPEMREKLRALGYLD
jgi:arylsulfatase A-like enzyme